MAPRKSDLIPRIPREPFRQGERFCFGGENRFQGPGWQELVAGGGRAG